MKDDPAFPNYRPEQISPGIVQTFCRGGLTKREYFAAMAMQGLLSANEPLVGITERDKGKTVGELAAMAAVGCADALIAELEK